MLGARWLLEQPVAGSVPGHGEVLSMVNSCLDT